MTSEERYVLEQELGQLTQELRQHVEEVARDLVLKEVRRHATKAEELDSYIQREVRTALPDAVAETGIPRDVVELAVLQELRSLQERGIIGSFVRDAFADGELRRLVRGLAAEERAQGTEVGGSLPVGALAASAGAEPALGSPVQATPAKQGPHLPEMNALTKLLRVLRRRGWAEPVSAGSHSSSRVVRPVRTIVFTALPSLALGILIGAFAAPRLASDGDQNNQAVPSKAKSQEQTPTLDGLETALTPTDSLRLFMEDFGPIAQQMFGLLEASASESSLRSDIDAWRANQRNDAVRERLTLALTQLRLRGIDTSIDVDGLDGSGTRRATLAYWRQAQSRGYPPYDDDADEELIRRVRARLILDWARELRAS